MKKEIKKKKWNPPFIASTLPIKKTLGKQTFKGSDGGTMGTMRFS